jgi:putative component of toxin-antitoxin plasmid stabilization module
MDVCVLCCKYRQKTKNTKTKEQIKYRVKKMQKNPIGVMDVCDVNTDKRQNAGQSRQRTKYG